ncbi:MAG: Arm DNA-binding domain-containing protein [Mariprofundaceae bacterium]
MLLSDAKAKAAKVPEERKQIKLSDGGGLFLLVKPTGKYWKMNYRFGDKQKTLSIGIYPQVSLKEARDKREAARKLLERNIDPSQAKQAERQKAVEESHAITFKGVADEWLKIKRKAWASIYP